MKFPSTSRIDLEKASRKNELIVETGRQIQKDFAEFGLAISFSGNAVSFYDELFEQMKNQVDVLLAESMETFMHFLYRIDINQHQVKQYENEMPDSTYQEVITELIIHRELKKVITRDFFRQQTNHDQSKELNS